MEDKLITLKTGKRYGMSCASMRLSEQFHSPQEQNPTIGRVSRRFTCKRSYAQRISNCAGSKPMADVRSGGSSRVQKLVDTHSQQADEAEARSSSNVYEGHHSVMGSERPVDIPRSRLLVDRWPHASENGRCKSSLRDL